MTKRTYKANPANIAVAAFVANVATEKRIALISQMIVAVYNNQTVVEKAVRRTDLQNQKGFTKADALKGSLLAEQVIAGIANPVEVLSWGVVGAGGKSRISKY